MNETDTKSHEAPEENRRAQRQEKSSELEALAIEIECISCGVKGRIKVDRLNRKLCCKQCGMKMYLNEYAAWEEYQSKSPKSLSELPDHAAVAGTTFEPRSRGWQKPLYDKRSQMIAAGLSVAILIVWISPRLFLARLDLPPTLSGRARFVCDAIIRGDRMALRASAHAGTMSEAVKWFGLARENLGSTPHASEDESATTKIKVIFENRTTGKACVSATLIRTTWSADSAAKTASEKISKLLMFWQLDENGLWLLDGAETLAPAGSRSR